MRAFKRGAAVLLAAVFMCSTVACGSSTDTKKTSDKNQEAGEEKVEKPVALEYTNGEPLSLWEKDEDMPYYDKTVTDQSVELTPYIADENANGGCVIICPGGGYQHWAMDKEGTEPAQAFNENGISAFVLHYRVSPYDYHGILSDIFRAIRFVRYHAEEFGVDPDKIAVMGFSAGGHLAAMALEHYSEDKQKLDAIDKVSAKPNAGILCYPVLSMQDDLTHKGSRENFLGAKADDQKMRDKYSAELHVTKDTAPCFVWHCKPDAAVPYEGSQAFADAMNQAGASCELHLYEWGAHGIGLASTNRSDVKDWFPDCVKWIQGLGF